jgi:hypothetical protein
MDIASTQDLQGAIFFSQNLTTNVSSSVCSNVSSSVSSSTEANCHLCYERDVSLRFACDHKVCNVCWKKMLANLRVLKCPYCRRRIRHKTVQTCNKSCNKFGDNSRNKSGNTSHKKVYEYQFKYASQYSSQYSSQYYTRGYLSKISRMTRRARTYDRGPKYVDCE